MAIEIGEKYEVTILDSSQSKRTILLNRGLSSGLTIENHANFYDDVGPIARGVAIEVAPMRSVWALYTVEDISKIASNSKVKMKITSPVKLTKDQSKMIRPAIAISDEETYSPSPDARHFYNKLPTVIKSEFEIEKEREDEKNKGLFSQRYHEVWGVVDFALFDTSEGLVNSSIKNSSTLDIEYLLGYEYYIGKYIKELSFNLFLHEEYRTYRQENEQKSRINFLEIGLGPDWHFYHDPMAYGDLIGHGYFHFGFGTMDSEAVSAASEGDTSFIAVGIGGKYYLSSGLGMRLAIEYNYSKKDLVDNSVTNRTTSSGVKNYRF